MKHFVFIILFVFSFQKLSAQVNDNFSDGDFTFNPAWYGDDSLFTINSNFQLQSKGTSGTSKDISFSTPNSLIDSTEWQCWVKLNLSPSSQNFSRFYLASDQADLKGNLNGYFVQFGGSTGSTDSITLYKQKGNIKTRIIAGRPGAVGRSTNTIRIKVLRDYIGNWKLFSDTLGGNNFVLEGMGFDSEITATNYCGVFVRFTSSNVSNYFFDDVIVRQILVDTILPQLNSIFISSPTKTVLVFNEPMDSLSLMNSIVSFTNGISVSSKNVRGNNFDSLELNLTPAFLPNIFYSVTISNAKDLNQNFIAANTTKNFIMLVPDTAKSFDIVISEIMADPDPPVGLPNYEYIEIYNRSSRFISLKNWTIQDLTYKAIFPDIVLFPDSFLIVTSVSAKGFLQNFGTCVGLSYFPSLGNDGDTLVLKNEKGQIIHALNYTSDWYGDNVKKNGGWSMEMIDPKNPCAGKNNWGASKNNSGGTPGRRNSVNGINRDVSPPQLVSAYLSDNKNLKLTFNESLDSTTISNVSVNVNPFGISSSVKLVPDFYPSFTAQFSDSFLTKNVYRIIVSGVKDCAGNVIGENDFSDFGLPENFDRGDVVINEILFNPRSGGVDFVELYNHSDKVIDLKKLFIANTNSDNSVNSLYQIAPNGFILFPKDYCAVNENSEILKQQYFSPNTKNFIQCTMPTFPDNAGCAVIIDATGKRYDQLNYDDKMHFPLLDNQTGASLERIDFNRPVSDPTNWTSASTQVSATPAYRNSQYVTGNANGEHLKVEPEVFSPDGDGYKDFVNFSYAFDESGYTGNLFLYDARGVRMKQLLHNAILGTSGTYSWNGITEKNEKAPLGIYVVYFEVFNLKGEVKNYRSVVVVGGKL